MCLQAVQPGLVPEAQCEVQGTPEEEEPVAELTAVPHCRPKRLEHIVRMVTLGPSPLGQVEPGPVHPRRPERDSDPGPKAHGSKDEGQGRPWSQAIGRRGEQGHAAQGGRG